MAQLTDTLRELCTLLVEDRYGHLVSHVFSTLLHSGRSLLHPLARQTGLDFKELRAALAVLNQQHLLLHYTPEDDTKTYYEANWRQAYASVRAGKIIRVVEAEFGENAAGVCSNLLLLGHARIKDLADAYGVTPKDKGDAQTGADHIYGDGLADGAGKTESAKTHVKSVEQLHSILHQLLDKGYVQTVRKIHFRPSTDVNNEAERVVKQTKFPDGVKGTRGKLEYQTELNNYKRRLRDESDDATQPESSLAGLKRSSSISISQSRKRQKLGAQSHTALNGYINGANDEDSEVTLLDNKLVICVNQEKFNVAFRNQQLVNLAARYIGDTTSKVLGIALRLTEAQTPRCYDELASYEDTEAERAAGPSVTTTQVAQVVMTHHPELDLTSGLVFEDEYLNGPGNEKTEDNGETGSDDSGIHMDEPAEEHAGTKVYESGTSASSRQRTLVAEHLRLLAKDPRKFLRWISDHGRDQVEYKVDFRNLTNTLMQLELENTIEARFGRYASRLVRILHGKGNLDEKQLSTASKLPPKEIRPLLSAMRDAGYLPAQEVPRDTQRKPTNTMYLWTYNQDLCRQTVLSRTCKTMARFIQRMKVEKGKVQVVIDKAERTDVVGNEEKYLTSADKQVLRDWRIVEEKLLIQLGRLDDLVALFRDFIGPPIQEKA